MLRGPGQEPYTVCELRTNYSRSISGSFIHKYTLVKGCETYFIQILYYEKILSHVIISSGPIIFQFIAVTSLMSLELNIYCTFYIFLRYLLDTKIIDKMLPQTWIIIYIITMFLPRFLSNMSIHTPREDKLFGKNYKSSY